MEVENLNQSLLQFRILESFRTGDVIFDSIIALLITSIIGFVINFIKNNAEEGYEYLKAYLSYKDYKYSISVEGKIRINRYAGVTYDFSDNFKAIIHHLKVNLDKYEINSLREFIMGKHSKFDKDDNEKISISSDLIPKNGCTFKINDDIYFNMRDCIEKNEDNKGTSTKCDKLTITLQSNVKNTNELNKYLVGLMKQYNKFKKNEDAGKIFFFSLQKYDEECDKLVFEKYEFNSNTNFDTIFFEEKKQFLEDFNFFINNKDIYDKLGIPYKLGMLLHGYAGTGKTSLAKAVANATKRHIISINLNKIKNVGLLERLFYSEYIDGIDDPVPINERIYLISEFDVNGCDFIKDRKIKYENDDEKNDEEKDNNDDLLAKLVKQEAKKKNKEYDENKITLGNLLETLDGCMECSGRMIIFTTNNADKIDNALKRPGRIDVNIFFKKCSSEIIKQMYDFFFKTNIDIDVVRERFGDYKYSHAEIVNLFKQNFKNPNKFFEIKKKDLFDTAHPEEIVL